MNYYVATIGNDNNPGSVSLPWRTLQKAATTAALSPGNKVFVSAGNYVGFNLLGKQYGGVGPRKPVVFTAGTSGKWQDSGVTITGPVPGSVACINIEETKGWFVLYGFTVKGSATKASIRFAGSPDCIVRYCQTSGAPWGIFASRCDRVKVAENWCHHASDEHGIYVNGSKDFLVRKNECDHNPWNGIHTNVADGVNDINTGGLIEENYCHHNTLAGMDITGAQRCIFRKNRSMDNGKHGIVLQNTNQNPTPGCANNVLEDNEFRADPSMSALQLNKVNSSGTMVIRNKLIGTSIVVADSLSSTFFSDENVVSDRFKLGGIVYTLFRWHVATGMDLHSTVGA